MSPADPTGPGPCTRLLTGLSALLVSLSISQSPQICVSNLIYAFKDVIQYQTLNICCRIACCCSYDNKVYEI